MEKDWSILRAVIADIRTALALVAANTVLHGWWFVESDHKADVISGFGVSTAVLGILVAGQPLIKVGIATAARRQVGLHSEERKEEIESQADAVADRVAKRLFRTEVVGGGLIAVGTLFNGYATAIARLFSLPV